MSIFLLAVAIVGFAPNEVPLEEGFKSMLSEKDLTGWKQQKDGASLDGKAEAYGKRFVLKEGMLVIDPAVKGDVRIETAKMYSGDVTIRFEFKPDAKCNNDLFFRGAKFDLKAGVKGMKEGEWNKFEIQAKGDMLTFTCNGEANKGETKKSAPSTFGIRAEFGGIEIRRLRIKAGD